MKFPRGSSDEIHGLWSFKHLSNLYVKKFAARKSIQVDFQHIESSQKNMESSPIVSKSAAESAADAVCQIGAETYRMFLTAVNTACTTLHEYYWIKLGVLSVLEYDYRPTKLQRGFNRDLDFSNTGQIFVLTDKAVIWNFVWNLLSLWARNYFQ